LISLESTISKRPRRSKPQDPQFVFDTSTGTDESTAIPAVIPPKRTPKKAPQTIDAADASADLYEPGDIVWCKLGGFPWWPALIVCLFFSSIHSISNLFYFSIDVHLKEEYIRKH